MVHGSDSMGTAACPGCAGKGTFCGRGGATLAAGIWSENPVAVQVLGVCSALAVTNRLATALVMGGALIFVTTGSSLFVSLLRRRIPQRVRMIAEVAVIATFVILFDQFLKAFFWDMSKRLGPYVGLIITNCIVMGRAEGFALRNPPFPALLDGLANGLGYALVLAGLGAIREILGAGTLLGHRLGFAAGVPPNQVMVLAPGAFFALAFLAALYNGLRSRQNRETRSAGEGGTGLDGY